MNPRSKELATRLLACLGGSLVLAMMVGSQTGTLTDFGIAFRESVLRLRVLVFLAIGVVLFLAITFWPYVRPYIRRPGMAPLGAGVLVVVLSQGVMNWLDGIADNNNSSKFSAVGDTVDKTASNVLDTTTFWFFDWLAWTLLAVAVVVVGATVVTRIRPLGYLGALVGVAGAALAYLAHDDVASAGAKVGLRPDHALGPYVDVIGFLTLAGAGLAVALSKAETAEPKAFLDRVFEWRPGMPFVVLGAVFGLVSLLACAWFGPTTLNHGFEKLSDDFVGSSPVSSLGDAFLNWLAWTLFVLTLALAAAAAYLRLKIVALAALAAALVGVVCTFLTLKSMTNIASEKFPKFGANWKNLGVGGFLLAAVFMLFAAAAVQVLGTGSRSAAKADAEMAEPREKQLPVKRMMASAKTARGRALVVAGIGLALFYPPTLPAQWQSTLVVSIGVYVLLSLGLNVVIGWAGLLDLGYIAFYAVGAYTTAYFVGALPKKPPSWLHLSPLLTIPFAIIACIIAGVILGAPTLRLRGDYLAIVTLGFGEIIQLMALNNIGNITGGTTQAPNVPHPRINLLGLKVVWGQDPLPYWYLLLVLVVVVVVLFYRLEGSRLGRAWAAVREDEVAAQASGVDVLRIKLLAFAIGASTSALAGTFYASQVGYIDPTQFTLQISILIVAYVVFGGMGSIAGAMLGAAVLTWLPEFLKSQVPQPDRPMWVGALLLAMMIFRPAGLLPAKRRKAELEGLDGVDSSEVAAVPRAGAM